MLFLLFHVGPDRFVIDTARVVEVLPLVHWKHVPDPPPGVAGIMNYRGSAIPVLDLSLLMLGRPSTPYMTTRIVLVDVAEQEDAEAGERAGPRRVALVVERVTGTARLDPSAFRAPDAMVATAPYLGPLLTDAEGVIQQVDITRLPTGLARHAFAGLNGSAA